MKKISGLKGSIAKGRT